MKTVTFLKPVIDLTATGNQIKSLRIKSLLIENALKKIVNTWNNLLAFTFLWDALSNSSMFSEFVRLGSYRRNR